MLQFWDQLENRRSKDNKMFERMWEIAETKTRKTRMAKTKGKREEKGRRRKIRRRGESNEARGRSQEISSSKIL